MDINDNKENSIINDNYQQSATMHVHKQQSNIGNNDMLVSKGLQTEIRQMKTILKNIINDQNNTNKTIAIKNTKLEGLLSDLNILNSIEGQGDHNIPTTIDATAALIALQKSNEVHNEKLNDIMASQSDAETLLAGVKSLMNIDDIVVESINNDNIKMMLTLDHIKANIFLDEEKKVYDIQVVESSSSKIDIQKIIQDVAMMPSPQDLRYVLFSLSSIQESQIQLQKHIASLRKKCIIKQNSQNTVQITLGSGISATLLIHECYPEIPGGVYVESIIGIGGWDQDELITMKANINASCFNNIVDVFNYLS